MRINPDVIKVRLGLDEEAGIDGPCREAEQRENGLYAVEIPASTLQENAGSRIVLSFDDGARTVHCGRLSARLSPTQFALLQYVYTHSKVGFEEAQDAAWGG